MPAPGPVTLSGRFVRLEPLRPVHGNGLLQAARDDRIWQWLPRSLQDIDAITGFIEEAMTLEQAGREYAFAVLEQAANRIVGSTRYMDITPAAYGLEIGWTWYLPEVWGTRINTEAKYLLMHHAFEDCGAIRVCFKTDELNDRSRAAILKLGARFEGILRNHRLRADGSRRGSAYYSVIEDEWPAVKAGLARRLSEQP